MTLRCFVALSNPSSSTKPLPHSRHELDELCPCPKGNHRLSDISRGVLLSAKEHFQARDKILQTYCRFYTTSTSRRSASRMYAEDPTTSTKPIFDFFQQNSCAFRILGSYPAICPLPPAFLSQVVKVICKCCSRILLRISFGTSLHLSLESPERACRSRRITVTRRFFLGRVLAMLIPGSKGTSCSHELSSLPIRRAPCPQSPCCPLLCLRSPYR